MFFLARHAPAPSYTIRYGTTQHKTKEKEMGRGEGYSGADLRAYAENLRFLTTWFPVSPSTQKAEPLPDGPPGLAGSSVGSHIALGGGCNLSLPRQ